MKKQLIIGCSTAICISVIYFAYYASSSFSWGIDLAFSIFFFLLPIASIITLVFSPFLGLASKLRTISITLTLSNILFLFSFFIAAYTAPIVRMWGYEQFVERSQPLIDAVNLYSKDQGAPPINLHQLVPNYLNEIPTTGVGSAPNYEYNSGEYVEENYPYNSWLLEINASIGILNWDEIIYLPSQNYDQLYLGGPIKKIGNWAYVHE